MRSCCTWGCNTATLPKLMAAVGPHGLSDFGASAMLPVSLQAPFTLADTPLLLALLVCEILTVLPALLMLLSLMGAKLALLVLFSGLMLLTELTADKGPWPEVLPPRSSSGLAPTANSSEGPKDLASKVNCKGLLRLPRMRMSRGTCMRPKRPVLRPTRISCSPRAATIAVDGSAVYAASAWLWLSCSRSDRSQR
jgi:hypothetical protein